MQSRLDEHSSADEGEGSSVGSHSTEKCDDEEESEGSIGSFIVDSASEESDEEGVENEVSVRSALKTLCSGVTAASALQPSFIDELGGMPRDENNNCTRSAYRLRF